MSAYVGQIKEFDVSGWPKLRGRVLDKFFALEFLLIISWPGKSCVFHDRARNYVEGCALPPGLRCGNFLGGWAAKQELEKIERRTQYGASRRCLNTKHPTV